MPKNANESQKTPQPPSFWQIVFSSLSAAFGVQKRENLERDFAHGNIKHYIVAGVVGTILFILVMVALVKSILSSL